MSDNLASSDSCRDPLTDDMVMDDDIRDCIDAEIKEMEKYKWCLGVHLQHDPLIDRSLNDIYCEWIDKYAADFRKDWENKKRREFSQGS
jgi:hypothetical protein